MLGREGWGRRLGRGEGRLSSTGSLYLYFNVKSETLNLSKTLGPSFFWVLLTSTINTSVRDTFLLTYVVE